MKTTKHLALPLLLCSLGMWGTAVAQEEDSYTYATYFYCDVTQQERADEIVDKLDRPIYEAAVASGGITGWGWMIHHTGGKWRRLSYHRAPSISALLAAQEKIGDEVEAKNKALDEERGRICNSHDDYIWKRVAGSTGQRGKAGFSVYYVCDMMDKDPLADTLTDICGSHTDYVWAIKFEK